MVYDLLRREVKEEAGIEIKEDIQFINDVVFVRPDEIPVVLVKFAGKYKKGKVKLEKDAFTDYAWVNEKEIKKYPCIEGVSEEIAKTIQLFTK